MNNGFLHFLVGLGIELFTLDPSGAFIQGSSLIISAIQDKDKSGNRHHLLDEYLDLPPYKSSTPSMTRVLVKFATETSFQKVSDTMSELVAGVLSDSTIHRLLQELAGRAIEQEKGEHSDCFHEGKLPEPGDRQVSILYTEADSIWVHLQREGGRWRGKR